MVDRSFCFDRLYPLQDKVLRLIRSADRELYER